MGPTSPRPHRSGPAGIPKGPYSQDERSVGSGSWISRSQCIQVTATKPGKQLFLGPFLLNKIEHVLEAKRHLFVSNRIKSLEALNF